MGIWRARRDNRRMGTRGRPVEGRIRPSISGRPSSPLASDSNRSSGGHVTDAFIPHRLLQPRGGDTSGSVEMGTETMTDG